MKWYYLTPVVYSISFLLIIYFTYATNSNNINLTLSKLLICHFFSCISTYILFLESINELWRKNYGNTN
jgi:hypothetical protein